jgi:hypothetical protein
MDQEQINILQALRDALKQRDTLASALIDDNIQLQLTIKRITTLLIAQRINLDSAIESLRHSPFSVTDTGIQTIRTLVLMSNAIKHLTGENDLAKKLREI